MSYCRWSSDNFRSDVYVYENVSGYWTTHVAGRRRLIPPIPEFPYRWIPRFGGEYVQAERRVVYPSRTARLCASVFFAIVAGWNRLHYASLRLIPSRALNLPHDGETLNDVSAAECAKTLILLRNLGYHVPQFAIEALRAEAEETA
ncbi:hypothetical protein [Roseateles sp.]|uniref:hypothetical protein n=1 Tax=Roseateles sp. TaxID=1971397 RepID=UPI0031D4C8D7